jgi:hypothetical protein
MITVSDVDQLDAQVDPQMDAANTAVLACTGMAASDRATWQGFYNSWKQLHDYWQTESKWQPLVSLDVGLAIMASSIHGQMSTYATQLPSQQQAIARACPTYTPPSQPIINAPSGNPNTKPVDWEKIFKASAGAITAVAIAAVAFEGLKIVEDFTSNVRK